MDFIDQLHALASRIGNTQSLIQTEEATKNAMIMPFIQTLGYNVFDPLEVTPELVADVGTKKGEKVDYAVLRDGKPIMLFECKKCGADLNLNHASQLFRYFHVTEARFGVLTNGLTYRFFTDLEQPNKMDEKPFFEFNLLDFKEHDVSELKKFTKQSFDMDIILTTANELKYMRSIQSLLGEWMNNPSDEFVRLVSSEVLSGRRFTPALKEQFAEITKRAFKQLVATHINDRLRVAMTPEASSESAAKLPSQTSELELTSQPTPEEIEGFHIIRSILRDVVPSRRIFMRDAQSYCAVLFDDNNRKPICRLRFNNTSKMVLGLMNSKEEEKIAITDLDEIYNYSEKLKLAASTYLSGPIIETKPVSQPT